MEVPDISRVVKEFEVKRNVALVDAENYIRESNGVIESVILALESQTKLFSPVVFEWLYNCTKLSKGSKKLLHFVLQFVPNLIYLYLHSNFNNLRQLKTSIEALLLGIIKEVESEPPLPFQLPTLSRPSIYHQTASITPPLSLTEAALTRHNQTEIPLARPSFTGSEVTVVNRLLFVTTVTLACTDNMTLYPKISQLQFCRTSIKLVLCGMHTRCIEEMKEHCFDKDCLAMSELNMLSKEKRFPVDDNFVSSLLHGIRLCLCQSCHFVARQALQALKLRAQYEVLPLSIQISLALERLSKEMNPLKLPFDPESHKTYSPRDKTQWPSRTMTILRTFNGQVLQYNIDPMASSISSTTELYVTNQERSSQDDAEYYLTESYTQYNNRSLEPPVNDQLNNDSTDEDDDDGSILIAEKIISPNEVQINISQTDVELVNETSEIPSNTSGITNYKVSSV